MKSGAVFLVNEPDGEFKEKVLCVPCVQRLTANGEFVKVLKKPVDVSQCICADCESPVEIEDVI